ncbi:MAG: A24 family peptidase [Mesorhizobium sp.]|nr:A24 family peptidase [Mesorhizobium sp.]MCO5159978.1 A24 family peptidase [Mesorhizobium sp.]
MQATDLAFAAALLAVLAAITVVDFRRLTIPDGLNAILAALGLGWAWLDAAGPPLAQIVFAAGLFTLFWLMRTVFFAVRKMAGLGLGDVKMAGAAALWFSPWNLPLFLFLTAISALLYVASRASVTGRLDTSARVPFGPFLGFGLFATWLIERSDMPTFIPDRGF